METVNTKADRQPQRKSMMNTPTNRIRISPRQGRLMPLAAGIVTGLTVIYFNPAAQAGPLYWDINNTPGLQAGSGNWTTSTGSQDKRWSDSTGAGNPVPWTNGSDAFFQSGTVVPQPTSAVTVVGIVQVVSMTFNGTGYTIGGTALTLTGNNITTNTAATISAVLDGTGGLTKNGTATLTLTGANTFSGATIISAGGGTISAAAGALGSTSGVTVNNSGTLLLAGSGDRVKNSAGLTLAAGGTLSMQGLTGQSETMSSLTLSGNSTIDFGTTVGGNNTLIFTNGITGLASHTLTILDWTGPVGGGTQDHLAFGGSALTTAELGNINFFSDTNVFLGTGREISFGGPSFQVVPVPEPTTVFGALALVGLVGYRERRRLAVLIRPRAQA